MGVKRVTFSPKQKNPIPQIDIEKNRSEKAEETVTSELESGG